MPSAVREDLRVLDGVRLPKNELARRFALSQRLLVRVGALLGSNLELTAAVLEAARAGSPLETLLLKKEILAEAASLDTARLSRLAEGLTLDAELAVEAQDGRRVIGLAEELAASTGFSQPEPAGGGALALSPLDVDPMAALLPNLASTAAGVMSAEEVARLKLTLLTGVEPKAKVEALRKLILAALPVNEKGILFLRAVSDESPEVRAEAAAGLRALGLDDATASAVRALSEGSEAEKSAAINALTRRAGESGEAERAVVIAALAADLRGAPEPSRAAQLLRSLGALAAHVARNADFAGAVIRIAIRRLYASPAAVADAAMDFFAKIGAAEPALLSKILWAEAEAAPDRKSKAALFIALARIPAAAGPEKLASATARLLAGWNDSDFDCRRAANVLLALGDTAVDALVATIAEAPQEQRPFLIRLADQVAERKTTSDEAAERFGRALVEMIRTGRRPVRIAALESRAISRASADSRRQATLQVISSAHDYNLDDVTYLSESFLRRVGEPAVEELSKALRTSPYRLEREIALRSLDAILTDRPELARPAGDALRLMLDLYREGKFPNDALLAGTLGRVAALAGAPAAAVRGTAMELRNLLREKPGKFELLDAYAWAVSSRHVEGEQKMSAGLTLLGLLDAKMPEDFVKENWTNEGLQLTIGKTSTAHTTLIPVLVNGLVRIALSGGGTDTFLEKITRGLLQHWRRVTGYEVMWSPGNISDLGLGLGRIAARRETPLHLRLDILDALRARLVHVPIARAIGEALALEETSRRMDGICAAVAKELCGLAVHRDFQDPDDRRALLGSLGRIAERAKLAPSPEEGEEIRRRIVELLFDAARAGIPETREALEAIAGSAGVPAEVRKGVSERLGRV